jgi:AraC-like DNA-binding protein
MTIQMNRVAQDRRRANDGAVKFFSEHIARARRFYLSLNTPKNSPLAVVCGGLEYTTSEYAVRRESFPYYAIEYVVRGRGQVKLNGRSGSLQAGRLFSYGPGVRQEIISDPTDPLVKYFVGFAGRDALQMLRSSRLAPGSISQISPANALQALFDELIQTGLRAHRGSAELYAKLLECLALKMNDSDVPSEGMNTLAFSTHERCRQYIQEHFRRLQTLNQISDECHVTTGHICRQFKLYEQHSPYNYLLQFKMNYAAELFQQGGILVKQAADQVGFKDQYLFSRRFKSFFGITPKAFRTQRHLFTNFKKMGEDQGPV